MNKTFGLFLLTACVLTSTANADVWNGPSITFSKGSFADHTLDANQDQITDNVHLTRADTQGLFNIAQESGYIGSSPFDTEWSYGTTDDLGSLTFTNWVDWHGSSPPSSLNQDAVLHLITDDIFIDIRFASWGQGPFGGGSFSYTRSTQSIPEPSSCIAIFALSGLFVVRRRRR